MNCCLVFFILHANVETFHFVFSLRTLLSFSSFFLFFCSMSVVCSISFFFLFLLSTYSHILFLIYGFAFVFLEHYAHRYILWWWVTKKKRNKRRLCDFCQDHLFSINDKRWQGLFICITDCLMPSSFVVARWPIRTKMSNSLTQQSKEIFVPKFRSNYRGNGKVFHEENCDGMNFLIVF